MRVIYKGFAATTYGKRSLSITDTEGKEILHTDDRENVETEDQLKVFLKNYVKENKLV